MSAVISYGLWAAALNGSASGARWTRFTFSAASSSTWAARSAGHAGDVDRVHVHVAGEPRHELARAAGQEVHHAARTSDVARTSASETAGIGSGSLAITTTVLPRDDRGRQPRDEPEQRLVLRRHDPDHARRLRDREVEVRAGDRVRGPERLGTLSAPARVPDPPVDRGVDARGRDRRRRRRPARRGTARGGPPSAPPRGTGPGRGCRRSCRPIPAARRGPRPPRRGDPCARPATRSRADVRRAPATSYDRPDSLRGNLPPMNSFAVRLTGRRSVGLMRRSAPAPGTAPARAGRPRVRTRSPCIRRTATPDRTG